MIITQKGVYPCPCQTSPYGSEHRRHVITGDLSIIPNDSQRKLISKGPKYGEQNKIARGKDKKIIMIAAEDFAGKWTKRDKFDISVLDDWINEIKYIVSGKIKTLQKESNNHYTMFLQIQRLLVVCKTYMNNLFLHQLIKHQAILLLYVNSFIIR